MDLSAIQSVFQRDFKRFNLAIVIEEFNMASIVFMVTDVLAKLAASVSCLIFSVCLLLCIFRTIVLKVNSYQNKLKLRQQYQPQVSA